MNNLLSPFLSNGLIIQRDISFPVWSRKKITVTFLGKTYKSKSAEGKFLTMLDPVSSGGPFTMDIFSEDGILTMQDIYSGDVWLCAGQSNMELQMERLFDDYSEEWENVNQQLNPVNEKDCLDFSLIRQFKVPQEWYFSSVRDDFSGGIWQKASADTLKEFSGTAWFFAKEMHKKRRVPVGLIMTAWGGTPVESWMSEQALAGFPAKIAQGRQYCESAKRAETKEKNAAEIQNWEKNLALNDQGFFNNWKNPDTDISSWDSITLPGGFFGAESGQGDTSAKGGVIWLAKDIETPSEIASNEASLWLGTIVDSDTVYINGIETGNTAYRYPPRKYNLKKGILQNGKNRIVIRAVFNNGEGEVTRGKPFRLYIKNDPSKSIELSGTWKYKIGYTCNTRPPEFFFQWLPFGNFNAMIAPVLKYPLKGVIWYQGESNGFNTDEYPELINSMIIDWRRRNGGEELPFFFVQLPIWNAISDNDENSSWARIREAQKAPLSLPATGMAAALELGEWNDLHPVNKKGVGQRLFLAADKILFGAENSSPGPVIKEVNSENFHAGADKKLYIRFDNCADGLTAQETVHVSVICGEGQIRLPAEIVKPDMLCIDLSEIKNPEKILYAWADNPRDRQLFNSGGLPAIPFRIILS